jgi:hypothetical protein
MVVCGYAKALDTVDLKTFPQVILLSPFTKRRKAAAGCRTDIR